ncbi:MAG: NAD-dependent epimerase/dehydratase family protein [Rubripirellula sp.]|nr:NAD-dependent epimerase/dehydratase family protein [Rubripirellula sp.]
MSKIAVLGASGFVGSTLVEELIAEDVDVRCLIHSSGNAWRLARHGIELKMVDLMNRQSVREAISGCTHVVNCARGKSQTLLKGMSNLLYACEKEKTQRLVHISSVAVYGNQSDSTLVSEDQPASPVKDSYGWSKLQQDQMIARAVKSGLSAVVLCPPNISGPYSLFLDEICKAIQSRSFAWVDGGRFPCPLVDVGNLVHAIKLGLKAEDPDGRRVFISDEKSACWKQVGESLSRILGVESNFQSLTIEEAKEYTQTQPLPAGSVKKTVAHLVSSNVRASLRQDPYIGAVEKTVVGFAKRLPEGIQERLRDDVRKVKSRRNQGDGLALRLVAQQLRNTTYSADRAKAILGYHPIHGYEESMRRFEHFAKLHFGLGSKSYAMLTKLG